MTKLFDSNKIQNAYVVHEPFVDVNTQSRFNASGDTAGLMKGVDCQNAKQDDETQTKNINNQLVEDNFEIDWFYYGLRWLVFHIFSLAFYPL